MGITDIKPAVSVIHLFQSDSLELREHLVMFQSTNFKVKLAYLKNWYVSTDRAQQNRDVPKVTLRLTF